MAFNKMQFVQVKFILQPHVTFSQNHPYIYNTFRDQMDTGQEEMSASGNVLILKPLLFTVLLNGFECTHTIN